MWRKRSAQRSAAAAVDASETTKPGTAPPTTLPPGSPLDSFIDVRDGDGGGGGIGASQVLAGAAGAGGVYYAPSRSTSSTSPQAQLSLASQSQGAATPQTRSLLPADYTTLGRQALTGLHACKLVHVELMACTLCDKTAHHLQLPGPYCCALHLASCLVAGAER